MAINDVAGERVRVPCMVYSSWICSS